MGNSETSMGSFVVRMISLKLLGYTKTFYRDTEKEIEIVYDLAQKVLQYEEMLIQASDICGELDGYEAGENV